MVTHIWNLCSAFNPSKCTHTAVDTYTPWTHTLSSGQPMLWRPNTHPEQWGVWCLAQGSPLSHGIEGGENTGHSLPSLTIPAGPEIQTHDLWVTSLTLYPLGHDSPQIYESFKWGFMSCHKCFEISIVWYVIQTTDSKFVKLWSFMKQCFEIGHQ